MAVILTKKTIIRYTKSKKVSAFEERIEEMVKNFHKKYVDRYPLFSVHVSLLG